MARQVWPHAFVLHAGIIADRLPKGAVKEAVDSLARRYPRAARGLIDGNATPVALRWITRPDLGFPRQPFHVFRRRPGGARLRPLTSVPTPISGRGIVQWGGTPMYEVQAVILPAAGATVVLEALDARAGVIDGQRIVFNAARVGTFRVPGISALRFTGSGTIQAVTGIAAADYANLADWTLVEVVGLPFHDRQIAPPAYDPQPQGLAPGILPGFDAARARLEVARLLQAPLPPTNVPDMPTPAWPPPDPDRYLRFIVDSGPTALLRLITECLSQTDDVNPQRLQADFERDIEVPGIRQASGGGNAASPAEATIPVVGAALLSASSDSFAATGLGYGTIDFPPPLGAPAFLAAIAAPPLVAPGRVDTSYDYMVTGVFRSAVRVRGRLLDPIELAALVQGLPSPETPANLAVSALHVNRPPARDAHATEAVQLTCAMPARPAGYGVVVSGAPGQAVVVNSARPGESGGFEPIVPNRPASAEGNPPDAPVVLVDPLRPVPFSGSTVSRYLAAAVDVFGRWSGWAFAAHAVSAPAVERPAILSARFALDVDATVGRVVPGELVIEFSWDWSDRSPDRIEFTGRFFATTAPPDAAFVGGFALQPSGAIGPAVTVRFGADESPLVSSPHPGATVTVTNDPSPGPQTQPTEVHKYRLVVPGFMLDFASVSTHAYELYARGAEHVRPAELSSLVGDDGHPLVKVARAADPIPPNVPVLPPDLRWTALPDSAGRARGVLSWPAATAATGYVVWEATESALRHLLQGPDPATGATPAERAATLQALLNAHPEESLAGFSRVNTKLISTTRLEVELPGSAGGLYVYRVSAVSAAGVESARSTPVFMAVPRQRVPQAPRLLLRKATAPARGVEVFASASAGVTPVGYRVYRVQSPLLLDDVGVMGPARYVESDPSWRSTTIPSRNGTALDAMSIIDPVADSWSPYHYRIVAVGPEAPVDGEVRGVSTATTAQSIECIPADLVLAGLVNVHNAFDTVITFRTNLPTRPTPLGSGRIEVARLVSGPGVVERVVFHHWASEQVHEGPALVLLPPPPRPTPPPRPQRFPRFPEINRRPPGADGVAEYSIRFRTPNVPAVLRLTDPRGREREDSI